MNNKINIEGNDYHQLNTPTDHIAAKHSTNKKE